ncbi:hypothetical protein A2300_02450 [Candidatus Falkowbacteria bacterium RIFOXYB2_FULL_35_7]|uniref:Penicillin-binding protein transpeptidase domain-containing protein n=1 Tax=Candidatus Falkowbacteria bacterium RIFOXYC2_FULL_36_12 TaxID=1798002 RepID=A0A1F5SYW9_9BACT|nr:MAG: hypothetical protein A2300_02450 [Candidatus Falkowbacteria bacterium RIFOXYB2_FULL_35_7]OGF31686.1 MAG: hypothetical protein A2478_04325 [Candidatus Falkowbacteria bacterium RIFOXYC2_FULL_36_12]
MSLLVKKTKVRTIRPSSYLGGKKNDIEKHSNRRIKVLSFFFIIIAGAIFFRLIRLQIIEGDYYYALASDQHELIQNLYPERGEIFVQEKNINGGYDLYPVATNRELYFVYAVPKEIEDPEAVMTVLFENIDFSDDIKKTIETVSAPLSEELTVEALDKEKKRLTEQAEQEATDLFKYKMLERLSKKDDPYEPVKRRITEDQISTLQSYNLEGIRWVKEPARYYPDKFMGSQLLGFVGHSEESNLLKGYYGIEGNYDKILAGHSGFIRSESDATGRLLALADTESESVSNGSSIILTIDKAIQYYTCQQLYFGIENFVADSGQIIVMNPKTGAIIAMCSYPDFDPNEYNKVEDISVFNNSALLASYEPGSVFKPVTMAAALDTGKVTPFTGYEDTGVVHIAGYDIRNSDSKAHGWKTMTQVLEESLNTGTIFASRLVGIDLFTQYVKDFGFGKITDIDISPEATGDISSLDKKHDLYLSTASFGQGITVTPLQMIQAYSTIANKGKFMKPYVVDKIINPDGTEKITSPQFIKQVISEQTSKLLGSMLVSVVENGHSSSAKIPGYLVAGKTGTAEVPDPEKGGYGNETIHTFVGYAPYDDPAFVMLVKLDHVKTARFADSSTTPIFGKIAKFILDYYEIPPSVK